MTRWLLVMADRLAELGVNRVVMEPPATTGRGLLPAGSGRLRVWLVNARDARAPPRAAQDRHPGRGLAVQARRAAAAAASFVPPRPIRQLRQVARYRADLVAVRTAEKQRVEDAQIKLSVVASDIFGVSGRAMLAALVAGERDPRSWRSWPGPGCAPNSAR